jgi:hypothetical protein
MKLPKWLARLFSPAGATAAPGGSQAQPAFVPDQNPGAIVHCHSGFRFPERVGDFLGAGAQHYDENGLDVSVGYNHSKVPLVAVTVYVYPCGDGDPTALLAGHYEECKKDIASVHAKLQLILEEEARISPGGTPRVGKRAAFAIEKHMGVATPPARSELYLFVHRGFFVKVRVTYPREVEAEAGPAVHEFLDRLAWP